MGHQGAGRGCVAIGGQQGCRGCQWGIGGGKGIGAQGASRG